MNVMDAQCESCIFGDHSPVSKARFASLSRQWKARDSHQVCHQSAAWDVDEPDDEPPMDEQYVCRGFYDRVFMVRGTGQLLRIMERLGGISFGQPPSTPRGGGM